jgi:hypothetical protein
MVARGSLLPLRIPSVPLLRRFAGLAGEQSGTAGVPRVNSDIPNVRTQLSNPVIVWLRKS